MKQQLIALFLVIVMVASAFAALGLATTTTPVAAATATNTTLKASTTGVWVNKTVTFTATLKRVTGLRLPPLSGENVTIWHFIKGRRINDVTKRTNVSGQITWVTSWPSPGTTTYNASFAGDKVGGYTASTSGPVTVTVKYGTALSLIASKRDVLVGARVNLSGFLIDQNVKPLMGQKIQGSYRKWNFVTKTWGAWTNGSAAYTDDRGAYGAYGGSSVVAEIQYTAAYAGDTTHWGIKSGAVTVSWWTKIPTNLTLAPLFNYNYTDPNYETAQVQGRLTDLRGNNLSNEKVVITVTDNWWYPSGDGIENGTVLNETMVTVTTNWQGVFVGNVTILSEDPSGRMGDIYSDFHAYFAGDSTYGPSHSNIVQPIYE